MNTSNESETPETVKRYTLYNEGFDDAHVDQHHDGEYVYYSDYASLEARLRAAEAELARLKEPVGEPVAWMNSRGVIHTRKEIEELKAMGSRIDPSEYDTPLYHEARAALAAPVAGEGSVPLEVVAKQVAKAIFDSCHDDESIERPRRMEYKLGELGNERGFGGLSEYAMGNVIAAALRSTPPKESAT